MDRVTLSSLVGNIVVIGLDGNIRTLAEGESPKPGELIIEEVSDTSELVVEQVTPQGSSINVTDDITALIEAIGQGQDPTQLGEDFETAAGGVNGSSPQNTGAINRTGTEVLASTNFETVGINGTGFSSTQVQTLLDIFQPQAPAPQVIPLPAEVVVQEISSPTVNEGDQVVFDVTLDQATEAITDIEMTLGDGSAVGGSAGQEGTDYVNTTVSVTLSDGTTQEIQVNEDGTFTVSLPIGEQSFTVSLDTVADDIYEGPETFTLTGTTADQTTPVSGTATVLDDGTGPGTDPDDDRPSVSISDAGIVDEGDIASFTVSLSNASEDAVQVQLTLNPGETETGDLGTLEYNTGSGWVSVPVDGMVTVPAGMTEFEVRIASTQDEIYEGAEDFSVTVTGIDVVQGSDTGLATIVDDGSGPEPDPDDDRPSVSISDAGIVDEGDSASFTVSLSNASEDAVQVQLTLNPGETEAGDLGTLEYNTGSGWVSVPVDGMVTVPAGMTEFEVRIASTQDEIYEGAEDFSVTVTGIDVVQGSDTGLATIVDDGSGPEPDPDDDRPSVSISDAGIVDEGDIASFTVSLSNASEDAVQVQLTLNPGETEAGDLGTFEYNIGSGWVSVPVDGMVTVPAGMTEFDVRIASVQDEVYEGAEDFSVTVTGIGAVQGSDTGLATIVDDGSGPKPDPDDDRPSVSISDAGIIDEGDIASFTVSLSNASEDVVQVQLTLNPGETEAGDLGTLEYNTGSGWVEVPEGGLVTVPAGMTEFDVRIGTTSDDVYEGPEDFSVTVTGVGVVQGQDTGTATIVDDGTLIDDDRPSVSIVEDSVGVNEGTDAVYTVKLSAAADIDVTVRLNTSTDGSNTAEADDIGSFVVTLADGVTVVNANSDGTYTIPAGQTELKVTVPTTGDDVYEGDETFTVAVQGDTGVIGSDSALGIIYDGGNGPGPDPDDDRPSVSIVEDSVGVNEGTDAVYTVKLSAAADIDVTVRLNTSTDDSNTAEADDIGSFVVTLADGVTVVNANSDGTYTIPAGQTELKVTVPTTGDDVYEGDETFTVAVQGDTGVIGSDSALGIIYDGGNGPGPDPDDDRPSVSIVEDSVGVNEGTDAVYTVKLSAAADIDVTVRLNTSTDDSNTAEADDIGSFVVTLADGVTVVNANSDGTYTIPAGQTELKVTVPTTDDDVYEGDETFTVAVQGDTGVIGSDSALGIIYDGGNGPGPDPDDDRPSVSIVEDSVGVNEGTDAVYTVKLSAAADIDVTVRLNTSTDDSNTAEADDIGSFVVTLADGVTVVNANSEGTYTIPAGQTELKVTVPTTDDDVYEGDETFTVAVQGDTGVLGSDSALGIIYDGGNGPGPNPDDDRPSVSIVEDSVGVNEGTDAVYTVKLSAVADIDVTVRLNTSTDDSNTAEADDIGSFVVTLADGVTVVNANSDGTYTIPAGQTELKVTVPTTDDDVYEGDETFTVAVQGDTGVIGSDSALGIIYDGGNGPGPNPDDDRPSVSIVEDSVGVNEGTDAVYTVKLSAVADIDVTVRLNTSTDDSNTAEADDIGSFVVTLADGVTVVNANSDGTYTIPAGQTELKVTVPTTDDDVYEGDETFTVAVQGDTGVIGSDSALGIIYDGGNGPGPNPDDDRPSVYIVEDSVGVNEGTDAVYTVRLSAAADIDVTVRLNTSTGGTNTAEPSDIGAIKVTLLDGTVVTANSDGTYTIPAGETDLKLFVPTTDDDVYEGDETFTVAVQGATGVLGTDTALGIIYDGGNGPGPNPDDDRPSVSISDAGIVDEGATATFTVSLSNPSEGAVQVQLVLNLDETEVGDLGTLEYYTGSTWEEVPGDGIVTVPAGMTEFDVRIATIDDEVYEGPEDFSVTVNGLGAVQGTDTGLATIVDDGTKTDDDRPTVSISDAGTIDEGNFATFTVSLSNASEAAVQVQLTLNLDETVVGDLGTLEYNTGSGWVAVPVGGVVTVPAGMTEFDLRIESIDDGVYEGPEDFSVTVTGLGPVQGSDTGLATIVDNSPPTARDFIISLTVQDGIFPVQDVDFDGLTSANEQRVEDLEDDSNGANDADLEIVITSLPEHGELYYLDNGVEVIIDQDFLNDPNNKLYENTDIKYRLTEDFFDEQSFDSADLLEDQGKDILVGSYTPPNSNLTFTGGTIEVIGNSIIFDSDAQISVDFANQQVGLVVVSPSETGQGDEISTGEYITLELDEDLSANEAKLNLASLNDRFNSGAAWLTAYIFLNGALVDVQDFYSSDITYTSNHEGFITVALANGSFDEIRLTPDTSSSSDKASFTLVGTEITSFTDVNDDFTYQAIDTDGALSNEATVSVDFNNVTAESVATADYNTQSLTLTATADAEANIIMGDEQDNELVGTSGDDIIIGGLGNDILTGGEGDDVFKWTEMKTATDTVTDFETGDKLDFADLFEDVSQSDISVLLDDLGSGDYSGQVDDISITVTERGHNSTLMIHKGGMDLEVNFDGASAADIANSLISNLEHLRE
ncbi:calcium-binding protein [Vibrio parahaemolyticus]|nr:calcium-binding protein [Vibrio parahaemolyticus]